MSALSPISGFSQITHVPSVLSYNPYPYYDYTAEGPSHQPPDNFNTGGFMCKSGLCGGGGAANSMSYLSYSMCSYDPYTGHGGGQNYCCNNEAKAAGCTKPCDKTTGDCTTKSMPGETCSTSADCFNDGACLSGRCCAFAACDHNGGHYPGMSGYEDKQRYRYQSCTQCGDTTANDHTGMERPGLCTSCGGDQRLLTGDPKEESTYWEVGVCAPKCAEGEYFDGGIFGDKGVVVLPIFLRFYLFSEGPHGARLPCFWSQSLVRGVLLRNP